MQTHLKATRMFLEDMSWPECETDLSYSVKFLGHNKGSIDKEECVLSRRGRFKLFKAKEVS